MVRKAANSNRPDSDLIDLSDEEQTWEDMDDVYSSQRRATREESTERSNPAVRPLPRKRKVGKTAYKAGGSRRIVNPTKNKIPPLTPSPPVPGSIRDTTPINPIISQEEIKSAMKLGIRVLWVISLTLSLFSHVLRPVLVPLCLIPGISRSPLCSISKRYDSVGNAIPRHADFPKMMEIQSKTFEQLLDDSVGSSGLAMEIKKAEMATTDLVTLVKISNLQSKEYLAETLVEFTENARKTSRSLQKLSAKINGAVDNILAVNDYALRTIENSESKSRSLTSYLWPLRNSKSCDVLTSAFAQSLSVLSGDLARLVIAGQATLQELDTLEAQLVAIQSILTREGTALSSEKSELLADLWTRLGGNRAQMRGFENNLRLLKELSGYKTQALAHVVAALQALEALNADMEDLRERVATPELAGGEIPLEVHVRSIRGGIERLKEGRVKAKEREEEAVGRLVGPDI